MVDTTDRHEADSASRTPARTEGPPVDVCQEVRLMQEPPVRRKRALIVVNLWGRAQFCGGGEKSCLGWVAALNSAGFDVAVRATDAACPDVADDVKTMPLKDVAKEIADTRPDLVVMRDGYHGSRIMGRRLPGLVPLCRKLGIPAIVRLQWWGGLIDFPKPDAFDAVHGTGEEILQYRDPVGTNTLWRANGIIVNSPFCQRVADTLLGWPRAEIEPPVIDAARIRVKQRSPEYVLLPGGQWGKGLRIFVELARRNPDERFLILAPHRAERKWLAGIDRKIPNVEVLQWTDDMRSIYERTKVVFIGTQSAETYCRAAAETRANGIPLLAANSGNLPSIAQSGGIVVERRAPIEEWDRALKELLSHGDYPRDERWCVPAVHTLARVATDVAVGSDIAVVCPPAADRPPIGLRHLTGTTGARLVPFSEVGGMDPAACRGVILSGGDRSDHAALVDRAQCPVAFYWAGCQLQTVCHPHELDRLMQMLALAQECDHVCMMATDERMAQVWERAYGAKTLWLPDCYDVGLLPPPWTWPDKREDFTIPALGSACSRRELSMLIEAARIADVSLCASAWIERDTVLMKQIESSGARVSWVASEAGGRPIRLLASCHAHAASDADETARYVALSAMLVGLPVIGSGSTLPCRYEDAELTAHLYCDSADPWQIASKLEVLKDDPELAGRLGAKCRDCARESIQQNNAQARQTLRAFLAQDGT